MNTVSKNLDAEPAPRRALSLAQFCHQYNVGRTKAYEEIKQRRLKARKCGARTIIGQDDAEEWFNSLPKAARVTARTCADAATGEGTCQ
jgi:hypothetical protein